MNETIPFELTPRGAGTWRGSWKEEKLRVTVAGTSDGPAPALLATLGQLVSRWAEVKQAIAAYTRALAPDHHVPLDPPTLGGFAARSCGFAGAHAFESLTVLWPEAPERAVATFYTGEPDGYATFEVVLERGLPTAISAFAS